MNERESHSELSHTSVVGALRMRWSLRALPLSVAFSLLGGVAGWLWFGWFWYRPASFGSKVFFVPPGWPVAPAVYAAVAAAVAGAWLAPRAPPEPWMRGAPSISRVVGVVLVMGTLAGVCASELRSHGFGRGAVDGAILGFLGALVFAPVALLVVAAAQRAVCAREGSIVARSRLRALASLVAILVGCASLAALLDWPRAPYGFSAAPVDARPVVALCVIVVVIALVADVRALARIDRFGERDDAKPRAGVARVDVGLGDDLAIHASPRTAYRDARPTALLVGDRSAARAALKQTLARGAAGVALLEVIAILHGQVRGVDAAMQYRAWMCDLGHGAECREAAILAERAGAPVAVAQRLHDHACARGDERSCLAVALLVRSGGPLW